MIGIKAQGVFWDMKPGATAEIERRSPFFAIDDIATEASTPITFVYSAKNAALSGHYFNFYVQRLKKSGSVMLFDDGNFKGEATLILESADLDLNNVEKSTLTGYLLFSLSNFYQVVKDKKLSELQLGGLRTIAFTTNNPTDGSGGYWQHFHQTWTDNTIPYVFTPIRNELVYGEAGPEWLNKLGSNGKLNFNIEDASPLVPQIRVKYLLEQIFKEHGFTVDFTGLNDTAWEQLLLLNLTKIDWVNIAPTAGAPVYTPAPFIRIDLRKHLPQQKTIFDLIIQLFKKYGWAPLFNLQKRECRYVALKEAGKGAVKDWTMYTDPAISTNFNGDERIFSFKNEIDPNDQYPSAPDFTDAKRVPARLSIQGAPAPLISQEGRIMYCYRENQWYQVRLDEIENEYTWQLFADNIYDDEPAKTTDSIDSTISTLPIFFSEYRQTETSDKRYSYFPYLLQEANKELGYRTFFYHGLQYELVDNRSAGELMIPYSSSVRLGSTGSPVIPWSNVYRHRLFEGSLFQEDYGIIEYWFQQYINTLVRGEETIVKLYLPLLQLLNYRWDDVILIKQIPHLVTQFTEPMPYPGYVQATLKRITKKIVSTANDNIRPIYVQLSVINLNPFSFNLNLGFGTVPISGILCDVKVALYSDSAGLVPYTPQQPLNLLVRSKRTDDGVITLDQLDTFIVSGQEEIIMVDTLLQSTRPTNYHSSIEYTLDPSITGEYVVL